MMAQKLQTTSELVRVVIPNIHKIALALDGSKSSIEACQVAAIIANGFKASVISICVLPRSFTIRAAPPPDEVERAFLETGVAMLSSYEGVAATSKILQARSPSVSEALLEYLEEEKPDLVVCGNRGRGGFERMLLGSVSSSLVSHSPSSVMVVREPWTAEGKANLKRILVATDGSDSASKAVGLAISLAKVLSLKLTFANVVFLPAMSYTLGEGNWLDKAMEESREEGKKITAEAVEVAKTNGVEADAKVIEEIHSPVVGLTKLAEQGSYDLIIIGTRGLGGFKKLALGSVANGVVHYAHCSVLVAK